ncbi:NAD-dependent epimerase/dehydratase family protein [Tundrisphaera sp. TA3]|uniref:NAD-dependent epimerase/dehydratase family protein n=1 Tax=Tundrisphaera sp. TA3 TaxID=3435775 RepID=UPI003EB8DB9A
MRQDSTLIVGCGYLGRRAALPLIERGEIVYGTTRSAARAAELERLGIEPIIVNVLDGDNLARLPSVDKALYCVGYDRSSGTPLRTVYVDGLRKALGRLQDRVGRLVYASSTGVYAQDDGGWVDETSATEPRTESGRACLEAEKVVREYGKDTGLPWVIVRFSGLYGPGRIVRRDAILRGDPIVGDPEKFLNMIHIDDAAAAAIAAMDRGESGSIYLASDDRPSHRREFYGLTAELLGAPTPRFVAPEGEADSTREDSNKRVSNRRMREGLGVVLRFPDFTHGLPAALSGEDRGRAD